MYAFISYQTADKIAAGQIRDVLESLGISGFLAHEDIAVSEEWRLKILSEIGKADLFIAVLTKDYFTSIWCAQESGIAAFRKRMAILPLSLDGTIPIGFLAPFQSTKVDPRNITAHDILPGLAKKNLAFVLETLTKELAKAGSYRTAEWDFEQLAPYLGRAKDAQILKILEVSADNGQVCHASRCAKHYLPPLLKSHGHLLDEKRREKLTEVLAQYRD
jgi:hypothetical protein